MASNVRDPFIGALVDGRYFVESRIARGGMATVYLATDRRLERVVALKVMHPHLAEGEQGVAFVNRFRREARAAARLTHTGFVGVYDQGVDGDHSYLTMEYIDGENLRHRLSREPALTVSETFGIIDVLLDALSVAHHQGMVHRDIKPENILLACDGRVKVADFGLARTVSDVTTASTGTILGTVAYLSPELITTGECDSRTDVYSTGIMLYEMLTGQQPFVATTPIRVAMMHIEGVVPVPSELAPWLPMEVDELVTSLIARDPQERPKNAGQALAQLRRVRALLPSDVLVRTPEVVAASSEDDASYESSDVADHTEEPTSETPPIEALTESVTQQPTQLHQRRTAYVDTSQARDILAAHQVQAADLEAAGLKRQRSHRRRRAVTLTVAILLVLGLATIGAVRWYNTDGPGSFREVPTGLANSSFEDASAILAIANLTATQLEDYSDTIERGLVVSASPASGDRVKLGSEVVLTVSLGIREIAVPDRLVGLTETKAQAALEEAGLTVGKRTDKYYDSISQGTVTEVSVPEGSSQKHNTVVTLTVSMGPAPLTIPSVVELTKSEAQTKLDGLGLKYKVGSQEFSASVPKGAVISQNPASDTAGKRTDTVEVVLSKGPEMIAVPSVIAMFTADASAKLRGLGFDVEIKKYFGGMLDQVRFQDPDPGTKLAKGSTVTITIF